ncbi:terminase large subunit [Mesorhizobium sp. M0933]|uniref:terminase large subunit n=1 Tax=Mesorhizobium sp. M0933 TaxID=2957030 RepID=UPI0033396A77
MTLLPAFLTDLSTPIPDPFGLGQVAIDFVSSLLLEGGKPFDLHPVQDRIVRWVFGNVDENGDRLIDTLFLYVPSGQAKSTLAAAITLMMLSHRRFRIPDGQLVVAAATKEQAGQTTFGMVKSFIEREFEQPKWDIDPGAMASRFKIVDNAVEKSIEHRASGSTLRVLSRTADSQEGLSTFVIVAEEVHAWNRPRIWAVLRKSMPKVTAAVPLTIVATTAGVGTGGIGHELYSQAKDIASGKITNPSWLPIIYEAEPDDDWRDEHLWHQVNFALGTFKSLRGLRNEALSASTSLTSRREFERYHLNIWHEGTGDPWIDLGVYDQANAPFDIDDVAHLPCYIGVDAGQTSDLTAVVALFYDAEARAFYVVPFVWVPAASIVKRSEEDSVPYAEWAADGFITGTDGASIDEDVIEAKIRELFGDMDLDVKGIGFDPYNTRRMMSRLLEDGLPVVEIAQNAKLMSPAMKATEKAILDGRLRHGAHPVLRWCFANVPMPKPTREGNIKPDKSHSRSLKIDAAVATIIAMCLATVADEELSYDFKALTGRDPEEVQHG